MIRTNHLLRGLPALVAGKLAPPAGPASAQLMKTSGLHGETGGSP
jgi:hypothetical protein